MAEDGVNAGDVRRAAVFVAFVIDGERACTVRVADEASAAGRLRHLGRILDVLWLGDEPPDVAAVLFDREHLRRVAARCALAEAQGRTLPPDGWLQLPAA